MLLAVPTIIGVTMLVFGMIKILPGNEVDTLLGATATPAQRLALESRLGLTRPLPIQYFDWLSHAVRGDLGISFSLQLPVAKVVWDAFTNTLILAAFAMVIAIVLGLFIGRFRLLSGCPWP
jgi:peptide/nickel transport system permease protein